MHEIELNLTEPPTPSEVTIPLAEILFILTYTCRRCGTQYRVPNPKLMYLYSNTHRKGTTVIKAQGTGFPGLPREIREGGDSSLMACENCYKEESYQQEVLELRDVPTGELVRPTPLSAF
ncbi:hypothetical protein LCGC14_0389840 [marine sediment metagenome]|uniref:Uncharacterized protein n=1 Tax=marine sediment metagenome TaxID=412755 RepID=A0A0F9TI42_9ZZZZ